MKTSLNSLNDSGYEFVKELSNTINFKLNYLEKICQAVKGKE